jgi:DNA-directed RNA polymerase subunit L
LRGGDTIVRTLNFASKAEEYLYEIDRNDAHRMLVQMLLKDKRGGATDTMVDHAVAEAARLRAQAEDEAGRRNHEAAVRTLEESTRELVKAIRGAGVYIPG